MSSQHPIPEPHATVRKDTGLLGRGQFPSAAGAWPCGVGMGRMPGLCSSRETLRAAVHPDLGMGHEHELLQEQPRSGLTLTLTLKGLGSAYPQLGQWVILLGCKNQGSPSKELCWVGRGSPADQRRAADPSTLMA